MSSTKIYVQAFCSEFSIEVTKKRPMSIKEATRYVVKELEWETAKVTRVINEGQALGNQPSK